MSRERLLVATRNEHKLAELREILIGFELEPLPAGIELPPEEGETFGANALGKARAAREGTGLGAIADDSGIEAAALDGRPGTRSARYAGPGAGDEENLAKLLGELADSEDRRVTYVCVIAYVATDGEERLFEGRCEGTLVDEPRGAGGFGYDPAFVPDDTGPDDPRTMAELEPAEKHAISHRGRAARRLVVELGAGSSGPAGERGHGGPENERACGDPPGERDR
jgi:XTP/dITP diphosphohydrolase